MKINAFRKTYDGRCVLDFSGLELERGKVYAIIGANGSGKSTLINLIPRFYDVTGGENFSRFGNC